MNLRPPHRSQTDINITPLIDIVFLLLIFFMVSTTFERESEIKITLPDASEEQLEPNPDNVLVKIDANEYVYIDDKPLVNFQLATIRRALRERTAMLDTPPPVIIRADAKVSHQLVVRVMDAARQTGLTNITFATRVLEE